MNMKNLILLMIVLFLASCGAPSNEVGSIKATVTNSKSFNPNISHGKISQYIVTISAEDIIEPIVQVFDGSTESGIIDGIPVGEDRIVRVEAINQNNSKIKEGESYNLEIRPSEVTETEVNLVAVPVFANLNDGNVMPNTRFKAVIFNDGDDPVEIVDDFDGSELPIMDLNSMLTEIVPDLSTGLAIFSPPLLPSGEHKLTAKNLKTGKSTAITIKLVDGVKLMPAPFFGAVSNQPAVLNIGIGDLNLF